FFFSSRRRHTRWPRDWSSDVCSSDLTNTDSGAQLPFNFVTSIRHSAVTSSSSTSPEPFHLCATARHSPHFFYKLEFWSNLESQKIGRASCRERVKIKVVA